MKTRRQSVLSIQEQTINAMEEIAQLFPGQDPIRLSAGVINFRQPIGKTLTILRRLAPHFKGEQADMIRLEAGFRELCEKIASEQQSKIASERLVKVAKKLTRKQAEKLKSRMK